MTVRVGLVGAGRWATQHHAPAVVDHTHAELVAFVEPEELRAAEFASRFPAAVRFASVEHLLQSGIEALIVAGPPSMHHGAALSALIDGIATLVEKPFTIDSTEAWDLVAHADGKPLIVGLTHQFTEAAETVKGWLADGRIGRVTTIIGIYDAPRAHLYENKLDGTAGLRSLDQPLSATFADPALSGGGQIINQVTHILGAIVGSTGVPISVVTQVATNPALTTPERVRSATDVEVSASCVFTAADGAAINITSNGASSTVRWALTFNGTEGTVDWDLASGIANLTTPKVESASTVHSKDAYPAGAPSTLLIQLAAGGDGSNPAPGCLGAHLVDVVAATYDAAALGAAVDVPAPEALR